jgi:hypothetical protein
LRAEVQQEKLSYSTSTSPPLDDPNVMFHWFVTGFADGEGCFMVNIYKTKKNRIGWQVNVSFTINLHKRDIELLKLIQAYFGGIGTVRKGRGDCWEFRVCSLNQILTKIIPHFDKYPLITKKHADYLLFKKIVTIIQRGEHLTATGLQAIINTRATLNKGLSPSLKKAFPNTVAAGRPEVPSVLEIHPRWIAGFFSGEGCFRVSVRESNTSKGGGRVNLIFSVNQHSRDESLIRRLVGYFGCGNFYSYKDYAEFKCQSFQDNYEKIIPFLHKHPILGVKSKDFKDWCLIAEIVKHRGHLTKEGLNEIRLIQAGMNKSRLAS